MDETFQSDEIDRIVDGVIENPRKAARLKAALHSGGVARYPRQTVARKRATYDETVDDLWDNVPV